MITWFNLLLLVFSPTPYDLKPNTNFHPQSNRSYRRYLQLASGAIVPIEGWHNDVNSAVAGGKYEEEAEEGWFGQGRNNIVGKEDPWYEEGEEKEAPINESEHGSREILKGSHPLGQRALMRNGILGLGLAKTAFKSLRGDTAEKLKLPEDRKRLVELVRTLNKPNLGSLTTPRFVEKLLDQKIELNIGSRKESDPNVKNELELEPEMEADYGEEGGVGGQIQLDLQLQGQVGGQVRQLQKPQPVLLLLKGWLVHV